MLSARYAKSTAMLLLIAAIPTVLNVYRGFPESPRGSLAAKIPERLGDSGSASPGGRAPAWVKERFAADDFVTRRYPGDIELFAARNYDPKKLFHFPELAVSYGRAETARHMEQIDAGGTSLPVHSLEFVTDAGTHLAKYVLLYGRSGVGAPIPFMIGRVPELFVGKREPMTLIYVQGGGTAAEKDRVSKALSDLLAEACRGFLK